MKQSADATGAYARLSRMRGDINGLRAIAVASVVAFHFGVPYFGGGFTGVDVFFVISGFLMTGIILRRIDLGTFSVPGFYLDRARRIVPALAVLLVATLVGGAIFLVPSEYLVLGKHTAMSSVFASNLGFWREAGYFDPGNDNRWLLHTWSLSVEWQFYLLYPFVLLALRRVGRRLLLVSLSGLAALSFAWMLSLAHESPRAAFFLLPPRAWEMLVGGAIYMLPAMPELRSRAAQAAGLALVLAGLLLARQEAWPGWLTLAPVLGTGLVIWAGRSGSRVTDNRVARYLGLRSYSIYLWHWPLAVVLLRTEHVGQWPYMLAATAAALGLGELSYQMVEKKTRSDAGSPRVHVRTIPAHLLNHAVFAVPLGVMAVGGAAAWATHGVTQRFSPEVGLVSAELRRKDPYADRCFSILKGVPEPCIVGKRADHAVVTMIGDSHADAVITGLVAAVPNDVDGGVGFNAYSACVPLLGAKSTNPENKCEAFNKRHLLPLLRKGRGPVVVVGHWASYYYSPSLTFGSGAPASSSEFLKELERTSCALAEAGPTYIVAPTPSFPVDVGPELEKRLVADPTVADISTSLEAHKRQNAPISKALEQISRKCGVRVLDPTPYLCRDGACSGSDHHVPLFRDSHHMTEFGNKRLTPMFAGIFKE